MSDAKLTLAVLQRISEFLADLPEEHLMDIADGKARLTFIPAGATEPRQPAVKTAAPRRASRTAAPTVDMSEARDTLAAMNNRDEGRTFLDGFRQKPELVDLAKLLDIGNLSRYKKPELIDIIVERTIGSRLNSAAIRQL
ncbi:MAG TPA: Rho termination factor N-terminal domain-containing protein [Kribbellaceae bacterium]|nr:Rho termination factor N-terminal domain-containing protein [Kribbellaceae bacterium]